jgi:alanyl-tRNA synthetase
LVENVVPDIVVQEAQKLPRTKPLYYDDPYQVRFKSNVLRAIELEAKIFLVLEETCFFPEGGGQPGDKGSISLGPQKLRVSDAQSVGEVTVHVLDGSKGVLTEGQNIEGEVDWIRRYAHMKQHTGSHIVFSSIRRVLGLKKLQYMGVQLGSDRSHIDINYGEAIEYERMHEIEKLANQICMKNIPVKVSWSSREEAERAYGDRLGITDVTPYGNVRVVEVEDCDVALCCGTHVKSTAECTPIKMLGRERLQKGVERVEFTVGQDAYIIYDKSIGMLDQIAKLLQVPASEIYRKISFLTSEREGLRDEIRDLKIRLAGSEALEMLRNAEAVGDVKIVVKSLPNLPVDGLKRIASTMTRHDSSAIVMLAGADEQGYLVGAAGQTALNRGIDMGSILKEIAAHFGGRGGGANKIAQAGGIPPEHIQQALDKGVQTINEVLKQKPT